MVDKYGIEKTYANKDEYDFDGGEVECCFGRKSICKKAATTTNKYGTPMCEPCLEYSNSPEHIRAMKRWNK